MWQEKRAWIKPRRRRLIYAMMAMAVQLGWLCPHAGQAVEHASRASRDQAAATLTVAPFVDYSVNGISQLQAVTGVVVNGVSQMQHVEETRALNLPAVRLYIWFGADWWAKQEKAAGVHSVSADPRGHELVARWCQLDFDRLAKDQLDRALHTNPQTGMRDPNEAARSFDSQFWQLEQLEAWNARQNIILHFLQPHPRGPEDFAAFGRYFRACLREIKRRFPDLDLRYVLLSNEPDYEYPRIWEQRNLEQSVKLFYDFFRAVQADLHREFPGTTLLGPGVSQFKSWDTWQYWTRPFLEQVPEANYFDNQSYARRFDDQLAWTEMLEAASLRLKGRLTPVVISETCCIADPPAKDCRQEKLHVERHLSEADGLFRMMEHPDQFAIRSHFYYHYLGDWYDMWQKNGEGRMEPTPLYWLFWLLRDLRGTRVYCALDREEAKAIRSIAARQGTQLVVALFNSDKIARTLRPQMLWPQGVMGPSLVAESLKYDSARAKFVLDTMPYAQLPPRLVLAPGEVRKLRWTVSPARNPHPSRVEEREFFAPDTALLVARTPLAQTFDAGPTINNQYTLFRAAYFIDDALAVRRVHWKINGHALSCPFAAEGQSPVLYVERAIPNDWVNGKTSVEFLPVPGASYRLMFASLVRRPRVKGDAEFQLAPQAAHAPAELSPSRTSPLLAAAAAQTPAVPIATFDHAHLDRWSVPGGIVFRPDGTAMLSNRGGGSTIMLKQLLDGLLGPAAKTLSVQLAGFVPEASGKKLRTTARFFFCPKRPTGYIEPYAMSDVLCIYVTYSDDRPSTISLYSKDEAGDGMGRCLWRASVDNGHFPLTFALSVDAQDYRLTCDKPLMTLDGFVSGRHGLNAKTWKGGAWFGFKAVTGEPGYALVKNVTLTQGTAPSP